MKPWQLGDGDNTVSTEQLRMEFIFDSINRQLAAIGVTDQTTFDAFANYIGYSTGGTPSYQDMQVAWTPSNLKLSENIGFFTFGDLTDPIPDISFDCATNVAGFDIEYTTVIQTLDFPNLVSVDPSNTQGGYIRLSNNSGLTSATFPALQSANSFIINGNNSITTLTAPNLANTGSLSVASSGLTSMSFPALLTCPNGLTINSNPSLTSATFALVQTCGGINANTNPLLASLSCPSLVTCTGNIQCDSAAFISLGLGLLQTVNGISLQGCAIAQLSLPSLVTCGGFAVNGCTLLTTLDLASLVPTNGSPMDFSGNALNEASVDLVLHRCVLNAGYVSGTVSLHGGTNAAPSVSGAADVVTLTGRGVTVTTN